MRLPTKVWPFCLLLLVLTAVCNPKIYSYDVSPNAVSQTDAVTIKWNVRGRGFLLVHDIESLATGDTPLVAGVGR